MTGFRLKHIGAALFALSAAFAGGAQAASDASAVHYRSVKIDGVSVFYREAGG